MTSKTSGGSNSPSYKKLPRSPKGMKPGQVEFLPVNHSAPPNNEPSTGASASSSVASSTLISNLFPWNRSEKNTSVLSQSTPQKLTTIPKVQRSKSNPSERLSDSQSRSMRVFPIKPRPLVRQTSRSDGENVERDEKFLNNLQSTFDEPTSPSDTYSPSNLVNALGQASSPEDDGFRLPPIKEEDGSLSPTKMEARSLPPCEIESLETLFSSTAKNQAKTASPQKKRTLTQTNPSSPRSPASPIRLKREQPEESAQQLSLEELVKLIDSLMKDFEQKQNEAEKRKEALREKLINFSNNSGPSCIQHSESILSTMQPILDHGYRYLTEINENIRKSLENYIQLRLQQEFDRKLLTPLTIENEYMNLKHLILEQKDHVELMFNVLKKICHMKGDLSRLLPRIEQLKKQVEPFEFLVPQLNSKIPAIKSIATFIKSYEKFSQLKETVDILTRFNEEVSGKLIDHIVAYFHLPLEVYVETATKELTASEFVIQYFREILNGKADDSNDKTDTKESFATHHKWLHMTYTNLLIRLPLDGAEQKERYRCAENFLIYPSSHSNLSLERLDALPRITLSIIESLTEITTTLFAKEHKIFDKTQENIKKKYEDRKKCKKSQKLTDKTKKDVVTWEKAVHEQKELLAPEDTLVAKITNQLHNIDVRSPALFFLDLCNGNLTKVKDSLEGVLGELSVEKDNGILIHEGTIKQITRIKLSLSHLKNKLELALKEKHTNDPGKIKIRGKALSELLEKLRDIGFTENGIIYLLKYFSSSQPRNTEDSTILNLEKSLLTQVKELANYSFSYRKLVEPYTNSEPEPVLINLAIFDRLSEFVRTQQEIRLKNIIIPQKQIDELTKLITDGQNEISNKIRSLEQEINELSAIISEKQEELDQYIAATQEEKDIESQKKQEELNQYVTNKQQEKQKKIEALEVAVRSQLEFSAPYQTALTGLNESVKQIKNAPFIFTYDNKSLSFSPKEYQHLEKKVADFWKQKSELHQKMLNILDELIHLTYIPLGEISLKDFEPLIAITHELKEASALLEREEKLENFSKILAKDIVSRYCTDEQNIRAKIDLKSHSKGAINEIDYLKIPLLIEVKERKIDIYQALDRVLENDKLRKHFLTQTKDYENYLEERNKKLESSISLKKANELPRPVNIDERIKTKSTQAISSFSKNSGELPRPVSINTEEEELTVSTLDILSDEESSELEFELYSLSSLNTCATQTTVEFDASSCASNNLFEDTLFLPQQAIQFGMNLLRQITLPNTFFDEVEQKFLPQFFSPDRHGKYSTLEWLRTSAEYLDLKNAMQLIGSSTFTLDQIFASLTQVEKSFEKTKSYPKYSQIMSQWFSRYFMFYYDYTTGMEESEFKRRLAEERELLTKLYQDTRTREAIFLAVFVNAACAYFYAKEDKFLKIERTPHLKNCLSDEIMSFKVPAKELYAAFVVYLLTTKTTSLTKTAVNFFFKSKNVLRAKPFQNEALDSLYASLKTLSSQNTGEFSIRDLFGTLVENNFDNIENFETLIDTSVEYYGLMISAYIQQGMKPEEIKIKIAHAMDSFQKESLEALTDGFKQSLVLLARVLTYMIRRNFGVVEPKELPKDHSTSPVSPREISHHSVRNYGNGRTW